MFENKEQMGIIRLKQRCEGERTMIFKAIKSWLLFEKKLRTVDKEIKKAGLENQAKYYTPVFDEKGDFHHWIKKEKEQ